MNFKTDIKKEKGNTYLIEVKVDSKDVDHFFNQALEHEAKEVEIKGFRKGNAPLNLVKESIDQSKLRGHALNHLLSDVYSRVIKENHLNPILDPRFKIDTFEEGKEGSFTIIIIEKPDIKLNNYNEKLKKKAESKAKENKSTEPTTTDTDLTNEEIVSTILETSEIDISDTLIEEETNRMMSALIDQTAKLGITIEQYLSANNKTPEAVRAEYMVKAESTLKADFLLTEIAINEKIEITDTEIEQTINAVPDEKSKEVLSSPENRLYIRAVLLKGKTLDHLRKVSGESQDAKTNTSIKTNSNKDDQKTSKDNKKSNIKDKNTDTKSKQVEEGESDVRERKVYKSKDK